MFILDVCVCVRFACGLRVCGGGSQGVLYSVPREGLTDSHTFELQRVRAP